MFDKPTIKMSKQSAGSVCAAKNCKNKHYNCSKSFFRFPMDPVRARTWAINGHREDLLENVDGLHKSHRLCSDHFNSYMFTNKFCNRLKHDAIPTIFPLPEGSSKDLPPLDHNYCLPQLVNLEDEEPPSKKIRILEYVVLTPEKRNVSIIEEDSNTRSPEILSPSTSTQTSTKTLFDTPRKTKYRETIRMLETENKNLKETVEKLENKLEMLQKDALDSITLEQYQKLTFKFCSSVGVAKFINIQVAQDQKQRKGRRYSKGFEN